jgi:hypothetical protein
VRLLQEKETGRIGDGAETLDRGDVPADEHGTANPSTGWKITNLAGGADPHAWSENRRSESNSEDPQEGNPSGSVAGRRSGARQRPAARFTKNRKRAAALSGEDTRERRPRTLTHEENTLAARTQLSELRDWAGPYSVI